MGVGLQNTRVSVRVAKVLLFFFFLSWIYSISQWCKFIIQMRCPYECIWIDILGGWYRHLEIHENQCQNKIYIWLPACCVDTSRKNVVAQTEILSLGFKSKINTSVIWNFPFNKTSKSAMLSKVNIIASYRGYSCYIRMKVLVIGGSAQIYSAKIYDVPLFSWISMSVISRVDAHHFVEQTIDRKYDKWPVFTALSSRSMKSGRTPIKVIHVSVIFAEARVYSRFLNEQRACWTVTLSK